MGGGAAKMKRKKAEEKQETLTIFIFHLPDSTGRQWFDL